MKPNRKSLKGKHRSTIQTNNYWTSSLKPAFFARELSERLRNKLFFYSRSQIAEKDRMKHWQTNETTSKLLQQQHEEQHSSKDFGTKSLQRTKAEAEGWPDGRKTFRRVKKWCKESWSFGRSRRVSMALWFFWIILVDGDAVLRANLNLVLVFLSNR